MARGQSERDDRGQPQPSGNWYTNIEQIDDGLRYHREALTIFQGLSHRPGLAQTYDLPRDGLLIGCDLGQAATHLQQAAALLQNLNERQGLVSTLASLALCGGMYLSETAVSAPLTISECLAHSERARQIALQISLRGGSLHLDRFRLCLWYAGAVWPCDRGGYAW